MPERHDKNAWPYTRPPKPPRSLPARSRPYGGHAPRVGTLGDMQRDRHDVRIYCEGPGTCRRDVTLPIEDLVARHGAELGVQRLLERAVCSGCGARWPRVQLQVSRRDRPDGGYPAPIPAEAWGPLKG
jgi:hypothetical protein